MNQDIEKLIKEVALEVAREMYVGESAVVERYNFNKFLERSLVKLSKRAEAVTCYGYRYTESGPIYYNPPSVVINGCEPIETFKLFTFQPIHDIEAIENRVAEACSALIADEYNDDDFLNNINLVKKLRSGEWRKYK